MIKIDFTKTTPSGGIYSDAIYLPEDHSFTEEEIEAMKQKRYDDWWAYLTTPKTEEDIPPEIEQSSNTDEIVIQNTEDANTSNDVIDVGE